MAVKKTYQVVGTKQMLTRHMKIMVEVKQGDTTIMVPRYISLKGHLRPRRRRGTLVTSEPALIKALDLRIELAGNKTGIVCISEVKIPDAEVEKTPAVVETKAGDIRFENEVHTGEVKAPYVAPPKDVPGITTVQNAKEYLLKEFKEDGLTTRDVSNKGLVTKVAEEKNIRFVDLPD